MQKAAVDFFSALIDECEEPGILRDAAFLLQNLLVSGYLPDWDDAGFTRDKMREKAKGSKKGQ